MPSETNAMSKQEEDTDKSNEQSVTLMTLNSTNQESNVSAKRIDSHLANVNKCDEVRASDIRTKFLYATGDALSSSSGSSVTTNNLLQAESLCLQDKTAGNADFAKVSISQIKKNVL